MGLNGLDILIDGLWSTIYIYCGDTFANCMLTLWSFFFYSYENKRLSFKLLSIKCPRLGS